MIVKQPHLLCTVILLHFNLVLHLLGLDPKFLDYLLTIADLYHLLLSFSSHPFILLLVAQSLFVATVVSIFCYQKQIAKFISDVRYLMS